MICFWGLNSAYCSARGIAGDFEAAFRAKDALSKKLCRMSAHMRILRGDSDE